MASIDPQRAQQTQGMGDRRAQQLRGYIDYVEKARASGNPQQLNAAVAAGSGFIGQLTGKPGPTAWSDDPAFQQGWEQLKAKVAMSGGGAGGSNVQSTYIDGQGNRVAIMRDGSTQILGQNDQGMANQTISVPGPDGRPQQFTFNKRTGSYEPAGAAQMPQGQPQGAPAPQVPPAPSLAASGGDPQMDALSQAANAMIAAGIPPERVDAFLMQTAQASPNVQVNPPQMQPTGGPQAAPYPPSANAVGGGPTAPFPGSGRSPFIGQSPAEKAAAEADAKARVEAQYAPQLAADVERAKLRAQMDLAPEQAELDAAAEAGKVTARLGAERAGERPGKEASYRVFETAMQGLESALEGTSTGYFAGKLPAVTEGQQIAQGGIATMAPILKSLFRTAGEGTFTDKDQDLLMAMVPTRDDLPAARAAKIAGIRAVVQAKMGVTSGGDAPQAPANDNPPVQGARKAPDGNWYINQGGTFYKVEP
jgi:hypothetical protein